MVVVRIEVGGLVDNESLDGERGGLGDEVDSRVGSPESEELETREGFLDRSNDGMETGFGALEQCCRHHRELYSLGRDEAQPKRTCSSAPLAITSAT